MRVGVIKASGLTPEATPNPLQFLTALQSLAWMNDKSIATKLLADSVITETKLADSAVTFAKLKSDVLATSKEAIAGSVNNKLMTPIRVKEAIDSQVPTALHTGSFIFYGGIDVPEGVLLCNGANVSRTTYANLFAKIGTKYGEGDGVSTFTLPNLDGRVLQGTNDTEQVGIYLEPRLPNMDGQLRMYPGTIYQNTGVFLGSKLVNNMCALSNGSNHGQIDILFNANNGNALYSDDTIQVSALLVLPFIHFCCTREL